MTRRFRLDSATAGEVLALCDAIGWHYYGRPLDSMVEATDRCSRLLLRWWATGHDPAMALRCPECRGVGGRKALTWSGSIARHVCPACDGRGAR
jgi:hypothetical protein